MSCLTIVARREPGAAVLFDQQIFSGAAGLGLGHDDFVKFPAHRAHVRALGRTFDVDQLSPKSSAEGLTIPRKRAPPFLGLKNDYFSTRFTRFSKELHCSEQTGKL